uniref:Uncharacterized protein n=1 Tax=Anabas testudineus TaxID=64144 RepID=A0A7N5ZQN2_ANATE
LSGHILQALRRGNRGGGGGGAGGGVGLDGGQGESEGPFSVILSKCRKKSERQGATNVAFESD